MRYWTKVDFPAPDGAEKMTIFPVVLPMYVEVFALPKGSGVVGLLRTFN